MTQQYAVHTSNIMIQQTETKRVEKDHVTVIQKKVVVVLISDKVDFKAKKITRDRAEQYLMIERSIHQEGIAILKLNILIPTNRTTKYVKQKLIGLKGEMGKSTIIVEDFNTPLSTTDRTFNQKTSKYRKHQHYQPKGCN